jgi:uncharacterized protein YjiK
MKIQSLITVALFSFGFISTQKVPTIKPDGFYNTNVQEPSDIALSHNEQSYFIVSDNGMLHETDLQGKIIRTAKHKGIDFEGVYATEDKVYVVDETARKVYVYNTSDLSLANTYVLQYSGGRNKGFESITYNKKKNAFILITEKEPVLIREYNYDFVLTNEIEFKGVSDVSSATWYNDFIYLLSDEDMMVMKVSPNDYSIIDRKKVPIINPEGIAFTKDGKMYITSDDMERIYYFNAAW